MRWLNNISIFAKLIYIQMLTAITVVLLISAAYVYVYFQERKISKVENLKSLTQVIATNVSSAILFEDNETAKMILSDLKAKTDIISAEIRDENGKVFAFYSKDKNQTKVIYDSNDADFTSSYTDDFLYVSLKIYSDKEYIGKLLIKASTIELKNYLNKRIKLTMLVGLLTILIGFILSVILQRHISLPIYELLKLIRNVKENNNYSIRSQLTNKDEIGKLSNGINEMLSQIEQKDRILQENNENLKKIVKERTAKLEENNIKLIQVNEDLVKAKIQAEQSKSVKELFLANMSHEIRTPLNAIIGFQQLLKETQLTEDQKEYVTAIDFAGKNLLALINDILDLSKIESGKLLFEDVEFDLKETILSVIDLLKQRALDKNLEIEFYFDDKIPRLIYGDSTRFCQILINLIGNALKFTDEGKISISAHLSYQNKHELKCTFEVADTGIGIDEQHVVNIFDRFSQASSDTTRLYGGTGLGLTICRFLVEGFGGTISVQSKLGEGSTFVFDAKFRKQQNKNSKKIVQAIDESITDNKIIHILLAEDVAINQKLIKKIADNWGYSLDIAHNGEEALEKLKANNYDVILMDIQMPIMNGFVATIAIRQLEDEVKKQIPIIALTAHASNAEAEKCLNLGMNAYMAKPFDQQQLKQTILKLVLKKEQTQVETPKLLPPVSPIFDLQNLYQNASGDKEYVIDLMESYLENIPEYMIELEESLDNLDKDLIYENVHKIKSPALLFGLRGASKLIESIEIKYKQKNTNDEWIKEINQLKTLLQQSLSELKKLLSKIKS